jgi:hypothetical protein
MATITFSVNLETPLRNSHAPASNLRTEGDNFEDTRNTWFPNDLLDNRKLQHGDEFTVSGARAKYLKDTYTTGDYALLTIVTDTMEFTEAGEMP